MSESKKLYFVKRRGMKYEPERVNVVREIKKVEVKKKPKPVGRREAKPKIIKKTVQRTKFKQRGLTKQGETSSLSNIVEMRKKQQEMRSAPTKPLSVDEMLNIEELKKKAIKLPSLKQERKRQESIEGQKQTEIQAQKALEGRQKQAIEGQKTDTLLALPSTIRNAIQEMSQQQLQLLRDELGNREAPMLSARASPMPFETPAKEAEAEAEPLPITDEALFDEPRIQTFFSQKEDKYVLKNLKKLFGTNEQTGKQIKKLADISSQDLETQLKLNRTDDEIFNAKIQYLINNKKASGKGLKFPKKAKAKPIGRVAKPVGRREAKGGGFIEDELGRMASKMENIGQTAVQKLFGGKLEKPVKPKMKGGNFIDDIFDTLKKPIGGKLVRGKGRPKGSKNKPKCNCMR